MAKAIPTKKVMTQARLAKIKRVVDKQVKIIRGHIEFEQITFSYHPEADEARRKVAGYVPELLDALSKVELPNG